MRAALLAWARRAELSCDRAALLVTQDRMLSARTMMKLCGGTFASKVDYEQFLSRRATYRKTMTESARDRFWADIITSGCRILSVLARLGNLKWV